MMAKKTKLPFLVEPKRQPKMETVGTDESGKIEVPRRGYLTVAEKSFMQQGLSGDTAILAMQRLAAKIAKKAGVQLSEVLQHFSDGSVDSEIFDGFNEDISQVMSDMSALDVRRRMLAACCLLVFRVNDEWSIEDTMELHPDLLDGLYALYMLEDIRSLQGFEADETVNESASEGK